MLTVNPLLLGNVSSQIFQKFFFFFVFDGLTSLPVDITLLFLSFPKA